MIKKSSLFSSSRYSKKHVQNLILFIWLSFSLHMYFFWFANLISAQKLKQDNLSSSRKITLQNIILETKTETQKPENEAFISDKNNISQSPIQDKNQPEEYNVFNPNPAQNQGRGGQIAYLPQQNQEENQEQDQQIKDSDISILVKKQNTQILSQGGGQTAPTKIDIKKKQVINLYNNGTASVATQSKEYAEYFLNMQKKIEKYYKEFFPIYQYYQGLLKNGEVVIEYNLNEDGDILNAKVATSYGSDTVDQASLNSVLYARNFGPLPEDLRDEGEVTIRFHFIYIGR